MTDIAQQTIPTHPGELLEHKIRNNFWTMRRAAARIGCTRTALSEIIHKHGRRITMGLAFKFESAFPEVPAEVWLNMQIKWDCYQERLKMAPATPPSPPF